MIDKKELTDFIESRLKDSDCFLVDIKVSKDNEIQVEIDSDTIVDIDRCVELTREIEEQFDRDEEDYELEVGSAGLTSPFKVKRQYENNIGKEVEVLTISGEKLKGLLKEADDDGFTVETEVKTRKEGSKRPVMVKEDRRYGYGDVKYTKYLLKF